MGDDPAGHFRTVRGVSLDPGNKIRPGRTNRGGAAGHGFDAKDHLAHHRPDDPARDHLRMGAAEFHRAVERRRRADHSDGDARKIPAGDPFERNKAGGYPRLRGDVDVLLSAPAVVLVL